MLIIFLKAPVPGLVKTRLAVAFGADEACNIYKKLTEEVLQSAVKSQNDISLYYYPPEGKSTITGWLGTKYRMQQQSGDGIGSRMKNAFLDGFNENADKIVLIGTDIPELDEKTINAAYVALENNDCVLGPSIDGGYYLIGFTKEGFRKEVFENIVWSTNSVLQETLAIIKKLNLTAELLGFKTDIDTPDDYMKFYGNADNSDN